MANFEFAFVADLYTKDDQSDLQENIPMVFSGSQETRARRRALDFAHKQGVMIKSLTVVASRDVSRSRDKE